VTLSLAVDATTAIPWLQAEVRRFAHDQACSEKEGWTLATVVSEAATNVQKFAARGTVRLVREPDAIVLIVEDDGPGLEHPEDALRDGMSEGVDLTKLDAPQGRRRGLGTGLGAIQRLMGELSIERRPTGGTRLLARYPLRRRRP
jgi:serine/threonine-protein kinase RsbT